MINKKSVIAVSGFLLLAMGWAPWLLAVEKTQSRPVDFRACNFREGKTMQDLDKVSEKFRQYANKDDVGYAAWTLTPDLNSAAGFDVAWLGAWPDGVAYGVSMERWKAPGNEVAAQFNEVVDCSARHEMAMSMPVNAPESTPEDGVLLFYQCTLHGGKTLGEAYAAHLELGQANKAKGSLASSWMFTPVAGAGKIDFDYYQVVGFSRYSDMGDTMEMFVNRGGIENRDRFLADISSCRTPNVYTALSVRARDER